MKKENTKILLIFIRYITILLLALGNLFLFYLIFTPLTVYSSHFLLSLFYPSSVSGNTILLPSVNIILIDACIAGSAYYLLLLLNFSLPMKPKTRFFSVLFSFALFFLVNVLRIVAFSILLINNFRYFDITHLFFWYFISGIIVFLVWILTTKTFKIKNIPFYTDISFIYNQVRNKKRRIK